MVKRMSSPSDLYPSSSPVITSLTWLAPTGGAPAAQGGGPAPAAHRPHPQGKWLAPTLTAATLQMCPSSIHHPQYYPK